MKRLIVFGPTGRTGLAVLERSCQDSDLKVTAYVRKPEKVPQAIRSKITIIVGDVLNAESVSDAIQGQHAVISALGNGASLRSTTLISSGLKNIIAGMRTHGVKRIVTVGVSFLMPNEITPFPLKWMGEDHKRSHEILKRSKDLDWICTAPAEIVKLPNTGTCKAAINKLHGHVVTTQDIAEWMLACIKDEEMSKEYTHQLVGVSSSLGLFTWLTGTSAGVITLVLSAIVFGGAYYFFF